MSKRANRRHTPGSNSLYTGKTTNNTALTLRSEDLSQGDAATSRHLLTRLLDAPDLARVVPRLAPEALHRLIRHCGLEACGTLVASATPAQLASVFDLDLWRHAQPGHDDRLDADRFGEWLDVLVDADPTSAARIVAAMDPDLAVAGLSHFVRVFDPATFEPTLSSDDEPPAPEAPPASSSECAIGGYLVRATSADAWDAIVALLIAMDAGHPARFHAIMRGCRQLSNSTPEVDGLDNLLGTPEQLMHDVAGDRERRQSSLGYSTAADARAFLQMARQRRHVTDRPAPVNPIVAAYFRAADDQVPGLLESPPESPSTTSAPAQEDPIVELLLEASAAGPQPRALLEGRDLRPSRLAHIRTLMAHVNATDTAAYLTRTRELAFLANTLVAGCAIQDRAFTPEEASEAAVSICNLGLERWPAPATDVPVDPDLVTAFELGWSVLHTDVCMFAAGQLVATLKALQCIDADIQRELRALRVELAKQHRAGTPWRARKRLDAIATIDTPAWASLLGLLDECPAIPAALVATVEGRTGAISPTAFEFISTSSQIDVVRAFVARLPQILRG